ncbi:MAG: transglycosylase domain-containing protein [Clostridia bacterium]|nr:transglycosylase domain-containing protein [Clostridia bacterium]
MNDFKLRLSETFGKVRTSATDLFSKFFKKQDESGDAAAQTPETSLAPVRKDQGALARRNRQIPGAPNSSTLDAASSNPSAGAVPSFFTKRTKRPNYIISILLTTLTMYLIVAIVFCSAAAGIVMGIAKAYTETTKSLDVSVIMDQDQTSFIYDENGELITTFASIENRIMASSDEIPQQLKDAFVAIEDSRFWTHSGIDLKRLIGVFFQNFTSDSVQGGSTITQQLIKQRILSSERSYKRKIQEAYLALQLERVYEKDDILTAYLNTIALGGSNYGVKAAAYDYFGKELNELTLRECAMLAGITQNPWRLNPRLNFYDRNTPERTNERTDTVLYRMYACGFISKEEYEAALDEDLVILEEEQGEDLYEMMYFVEYAVSDVVTFMLQQNNLEDTYANRQKCEMELRTGGYNIYLTVDTEIQKSTEEVIYNYSSWPRMSSSSDSVVTSQNSDGTIIEIPQPQVAVVVLDHNSGEMKAIVGGRQAPTAQKQLNRAYQNSMPIGSTIKPIAVYGPAFDNGASPGTVLADMPVRIEGWGGRGYPNNYSMSFSGPVSIRVGLRNSLNVIAARVVADWVGVETSANYLLNMGVAESHINKDLSGLALGTSGLTMVELATCYGTIANNGVYQQPIAFSRVTDADGNLVIDPKASRITRQIYKETSVWMLKDVMRNYSSAATLNMPMGGKTGTNSDWRGITFAGFTAYYTCALYIGHDNYKPLARSSTGSTAAAPLWRRVMSPIHQGLERRDIQTTSASALGLTTSTVCGVSGLPCNDACRADKEHPPVSDYYVPGTQPGGSCNMHISANGCTASQKLATEYCPAHLVESSVIVNLAGTAYAGMEKYITNAGSADMTYETNPEAFCPLHTAEWSTNYEALSAAVSIAQSRISIASGLLSSPYISDSDYARLSSAINNVSAKIGQDYSTASIADINVAEASIRTASDDLSSLTTTVSGNIANNTPVTPPPTGGEGEGGETGGGEGSGGETPVTPPEGGGETGGEGEGA